MKNRITVREAVTENDVALIWEQLHVYFKRDMFSDLNAEERDCYLGYFLGDEYRSAMQEMHDRLEDRCYYLFFQQNGQDIGFALSAIYTSEGANASLWNSAYILDTVEMVQVKNVPMFC